MQTATPTRAAQVALPSDSDPVSMSPRTAARNVCYLLPFLTSVDG